MVACQILQYAGDWHHHAPAGATEAENELLLLGGNEGVAIKVNIRGDRLTAEALRLA